MKKRSFFPALRPGGVLRWSTVCIMASAAAGLTGCDSGVRSVMSEDDTKMAETQFQVEKIDQQETSLKSGLVEHNFHIPKVGYYHAGVHDFYEHPYGHIQDGKYYVNGQWEDQPGAEGFAASRPSPEALKKVDAALEKEQVEQGTAGNNSNANHNGGFGMGNALMMYWLLAGNRGMFSPGAGFQRANGQASNWQRGVDGQRSAVRSYASANPGYQRMVDQSRASGRSVGAGQSVRGGFGSRSGSTSFGS